VQAGGTALHVPVESLAANQGSPDCRGQPLQIWPVAMEPSEEPTASGGGSQAAQASADTAAGPGVMTSPSRKSPAAPAAEGCGFELLRSLSPTGNRRALSPMRSTGGWIEAADSAKAGSGCNAAGPLPREQLDVRRGDAALDGTRSTVGPRDIESLGRRSADGTVPSVRDEFQALEKASVASEVPGVGVMPGSPTMSHASTTLGVMSRCSPSAAWEQLAASVGGEADGKRDAHTGQELQGIRSEIERLRAETLARRASRAFAATMREQGGARPAPQSPVPTLSSQSGALEEGSPAVHQASLSAAEAALTAAEVALAQPAPAAGSWLAGGPRSIQGQVAEASEGGAGTAASATGMLAMAEGLQQQLDEVVASLRSEQRSREVLCSTVGDLERRLSDGLQSMGEIASARMATDGATDAMLNALRKCVDELSEQCAWPVAGEGEQQPPSLAEAVWQQQLQLGQVRRLQEQLQAQQEEERGQAAALVERHARRLDEVTAVLPARQEQLAQALQALQAQVDELSAAQAQGARCLEAQLQAAVAGGGAGAPQGELAAAVRSMEGELQALQGERGQAAEALRTLGEQQCQLQAVQQQLAASNTLAVSVQAMQGQLQQLQGERGQVSEALKAAAEQQAQLQAMQQQLLAREGGAGAEGPSGGLAVVEAQLQQLQAEKQQVAGALRAMGEQQQQLQTMQQQLLAAGAGKPEANELSHSVRSMEGQLQLLHGEKGQVAEALRAIRDQQQQFQLAQQQQEQDLKAALAHARSGEEHAVAVQELRAEVTVIASAVNMLCGRVEQLSAQDTQSSLQTEVGAIANVVSQLSERMDRLDPRKERRSHSPLRMTPEHRPPVLAEDEPVETAQALRHQLAALVGDVRRLSVSSPSGDHGDSLSDDAACSRSSGQRDRNSGQLPLQAPQSLTSQKAPSPRRWLMEPLSVAVAKPEPKRPGKN